MKKTELEGVSGACKPREIAAIVVALDDIYSSLYARTLNNTPANEAAIRGF